MSASNSNSDNTENPVEEFHKQTQNYFNNISISVKQPSGCSLFLSAASKCFFSCGTKTNIPTTSPIEMDEINRHATKINSPTDNINKAKSVRHFLQSVGYHLSIIEMDLLKYHDTAKKSLRASVVCLIVAGIIQAWEFIADNTDTGITIVNSMGGFYSFAHSLHSGYALYPSKNMNDYLSKLLTPDNLSRFKVCEQALKTLGYYKAGEENDSVEKEYKTITTNGYKAKHFMPLYNQGEFIKRAIADIDGFLKQPTLLSDSTAPTVANIDESKLSINAPASSSPSSSLLSGTADSSAARGEYGSVVSRERLTSAEAINKCFNAIAKLINPGDTYVVPVTSEGDSASSSAFSS